MCAKFLIKTWNNIYMAQKIYTCKHIFVSPWKLLKYMDYWTGDNTCWKCIHWSFSKLIKYCEDNIQIHPFVWMETPHIHRIYPIILPLIEILKFDWLRQILYAAILCFLTNLIFLIYPLHVTYWPHITFLNPFHVTLRGILHYDVTQL